MKKISSNLTGLTRSRSQNRIPHSAGGMDVEDEWELLSDEGFLQITENGGGHQIYPAVFHMNYFICPEFVEEEEEEESLDQDPVSQVFFKKMKEAEFVDMKVESPRPSGVVPQIEANFQIEGEEEGGDNVWRWNLGAICSLGVAAVTFCIIVLTNNKKHPQSSHHHNHNIRFRIYSQDKRMKAVNGLPVNRARITVGGYYDASK